MNEPVKPAAPPTPAADARAERLAAQLRANLHRRKAQARAVRDADAAPASDSAGQTDQ